MVKKCRKCEIERNYSEFYKDKRNKDGLMSWCRCCLKKYRQDNIERVFEYKKQYYQEKKEYYNEYNKQYYQENKDSIKGRSKQYYQDNRELRSERSKQYYQENKERIMDYYEKRRKTDPLFKMAGNLRNRTYQAFKYNGYSKNTKTQQMLGVSWEVCKAHIENQFTKGMNWDNYGEWHIDHIIPLASANTEKELTKLCHYSNLQPLWAEDNLSKGSKIESQQMKLTI